MTLGFAMRALGRYIVLVIITVDWPGQHPR